MGYVVAIYARISTVDKKQDINLQLNDMVDYCKRMKYQYEIYKDEGISGSKENRPGFDKLMNDADLRKFDMVMVWKLDRLSRSLRHLLDTVDFFQKKGIEFRSHTQQIDTTTATGKLTFQIFGAFAEFERSILSERVKAGMALAKKKGVKLGKRPKKIKPETVDLIKLWHKEGLSLRKIADREDVKTSYGGRISYQTIRRLLNGVDLL